MAKSKTIARALYLASFGILTSAIVLSKDLVELIGTAADLSAYFEAGLKPAGVGFVAALLSIAGIYVDPSPPEEINWDELP